MEKKERTSERAFIHVLDHLENAKNDINFAENIIREALKHSKESVREEDKNGKFETKTRKEG